MRGGRRPERRGDIGSLPSSDSLESSGARVDAVDDSQRRQRIFEITTRSRALDYGVHEVCPLQTPRQICSGVLVDDRLGRAHLGTHLVVVQSLHSVAAAEPLQLQLREPRIDLERKYVLPFGPRDV